MMKAFLFVLFYQTLMCRHAARGMILGDLIPLCSANDPELNDCVRESAQKLIPLISKGVPLLKIPPLDPMHSPEIKLSEDDEKIKIDILYTDVTQLGLSDIVVDRAVMDLKDGLMVFNATIPVFRFTGDYVADGHILEYQMVGSGKSNITIQNAKSDLVINFHLENDHIVEDNVDFTYNFHTIHLDYENIEFHGDKELGESATTFINENAVEIMNGFKPSLNRYYGGLLKNYLKGFFEAIPYSSLFKDA